LPEELRFARDRVTTLLVILEQMAAGDARKKLPTSPLRDELDAIAFGVNVLVGELRWASARLTEAEQRRSAELQRSKEEAERANEAKSVFLRNASHEIRTPIAAILSIADLLALTDLSDRDRFELVDRLRANGEALLSLIGNVLDLSRLDAGKIALSEEPVSPIEVVREVLKSLDAEATKKGIAVSLELEPDLDLEVVTDRQRLRQVLVNLMANAIKFTARGGVRVSLASIYSDEGPLLAIDVADTGVGIAPDRHPYLFEPFEQADLTVSQTHGGTGLGLALSRRLAEQLGGTLSLRQSVPGHGSTFRLTLRARRPDDVSPNSPQAPAAIAPSTPHRVLDGVRVLLAEDNADMQLAIAKMLKSVGASVECAYDGREAVAKAMSRPFDIVLMDVRMARWDGLEATRLLRSEGYRLPIVALSAFVTTELQTVCLDAGCNAYLSKPFKLNDLIASIRLLVGDRPDLRMS
jgi:signal transduction histidine kinase/CheY-like chemotaxis protein